MRCTFNESKWDCHIIGDDLTDVTFAVVTNDLSDGEFVVLIGDTANTGNWDPNNGISLHTSEEICPQHTVTLRLPSDIVFHYKYCIVEYCKVEVGIIVVKRFETAKDGRSRDITPSGYALCVDDGEFGRIDSEDTDKDNYGFDEGWLFNMYEMRIRLGSRVKSPVRLLDYEEHKIRMRAVQYRDKHDPRRAVFSSENDVEKIPMFITVMSAANIDEGVSGDHGLSAHRIVQPPDGWEFKSGEIIHYAARMSNLLENARRSALLVEILRIHHNNNDEDRIGCAVVLPSMVTGRTGGILTLAILDDNLLPVGEFLCDYLIIRPFHHPNNNLSALWATHWEKRDALNIGHRGDGAHDSEHVRMNNLEPTKEHKIENTIDAFVKAAEKGADFVEFDVQLSKDRVPVVYHNFKTCINLVKSNSSVAELFDIFINDLTLAQLRRLKLEFTTQKNKMFSKLLREKMNDILALSNNRSPIKEEGNDAHKPIRRKRSASSQHTMAISTLLEVFKGVPETVGFNIEVKYPCPLLGTQDRDDWENRNEYVDAILEVALHLVIFENVGMRKIVISCFDPDVCTLFRLKQPRFPVFFLTCGGNRAYGEHKDARSMSIEHAVAFAKSERLLGIVANSTPLVENPQLIPFVRSQGLVLFTWGELNNNREHVLMQRRLGVDAVISDDVSLHAEVKYAVEEKEVVSPPTDYGRTSIHPSIANAKWALETCTVDSRKS